MSSVLETPRDLGSPRLISVVLSKSSKFINQTSLTYGAAQPAAGTAPPTTPVPQQSPERDLSNPTNGGPNRTALALGTHLTQTLNVYGICD